MSLQPGKVKFPFLDPQQDPRCENWKWKNYMAPGKYSIVGGGEKGGKKGGEDSSGSCVYIR